MARSSIFVVNKFPDVQHACFFSKDLLEEGIDAALFLGVAGDQSGILVDDFFKHNPHLNGKFCTRLKLLCGFMPAVLYRLLPFLYVLGPNLENIFTRKRLIATLGRLLDSAKFVFIDYTVASLVARSPNLSVVTSALMLTRRRIIVLPHSVQMFRESPEFYKPIANAFSKLKDNFEFVVHSDAQRLNLAPLNLVYRSVRSAWLDQFLSWIDFEREGRFSESLKVCIALPGLPRGMSIDLGLIDYVEALGHEVCIVQHPRSQSLSGNSSIRFDENPAITALISSDLLICGVSAIQVYAYGMGVPVLIAKELIIPPDYQWCESSITCPPVVERQELQQHLNDIDQLRQSAAARKNQIEALNETHPRLAQSLMRVKS